jgi:hypothetical protein
MEKAKAMPDRKKFVDRVMHFELTPKNIAYVKSSFRGAEFIVPASEGKRNLVNSPRMPFVTAYEPTALQAEAFTKSRGQKLFAFFEKPGSGKTKMMLDWAVDQWCSGDIDGLFVLSYAGVHEQWIYDEAPKHLSSKLPWFGVPWKAGKKLDDRIFKPDPNVFRVFSMNYESYAVSDAGFAAAKKFADSGAMAAAADESQRLKADESKVSDRAIGNRDDWVSRVLGSGEPTPLGIQDYYAQFCFLDPKIVGCWTLEGFKSMFCRMGGYENRTVIGYHNQEYLHKRMAPYVHVGAPDIAAKQIFEVSRFNLGQRVREAYDQLKEELVLDLSNYDPESGIYRLRSELAKATKLREIACGRITDREGKVHQIDNTRMELLMSLLDIYRGNKAIIWSCFKEDHRMQAEALAGKAEVLNGDTPKGQRREMVERFKDSDSGLQYLICSPAAGGTGWNMQGAAWRNIYYCSNNNAGQIWQSWMRLYRLGTTKDVHSIDIVARNTVDIGTLNSNRRKRDISDMSISEFKSIMNDTQVENEDFTLSAFYGDE